MWLDSLTTAHSLVRANFRYYFIHTFLILDIGFVITLLSLSYSGISCRTGIPGSQLFWVYFIFNSAVFIGAIITPHICKIATVFRVQFACLSVLSSSLWLLSFVSALWVLVVLFLSLGVVAGIAFSATIHYFVKLFPQPNFCLTHSLLLFCAIGNAVATLLFTSSSKAEQSQCSHIHTHLNHQHAYTHIPSLEKFQLNPLFRLDYVCFVFAIVQIPLMYILLTTKVIEAEAQVEQNREQYENIDSENNDVISLKLVLLSAVIACTANVLQTLFPFLILSQNNGSIMHYQVFAIFFVWGRAVAMVVADKMASYFYIGLSILGCGVACCAFVFEDAVLLGSVLFGFFLSTFLPSLILYLKHTLALKVDTLYILMSGSSFGYLIYPLFLTLANSSESRVFIALNFFAILLLVLLYVSMLNIQASLERTKATQDSLKMFIDRFFSGENLMKRTRSIRPLISRLRPNSYRRFRNRGRTPTGTSTNSSAVPKIQVTLEKQPQIQYN